MSSQSLVGDKISAVSLRFDSAPAVKYITLMNRLIKRGGSYLCSEAIKSGMDLESLSHSTCRLLEKELL